SRRYQNHFVALKTFGDVEQLGAKCRLSAPDPLQELRSRRGGRRHDVERLVSPMAWHLSAARSWINCRPHRFVKHLGGRDAELEPKRSIAIVGVVPIIGRLEDHPRCSADGLLDCAGGLNADL